MLPWFSNKRILSISQFWRRFCTLIKNKLGRHEGNFCYNGSALNWIWGMTA